MPLSSAGMGFFDERILSHDRYLPNTKSAIQFPNDQTIDGMKHTSFQTALKYYK